ncbi:MAG: hypothetical protein GXX90_09300 [Microbacteriaceae bacterium]|nr:hypothetical protein [Microbacteriaceae bacterium]
MYGALWRVLPGPWPVKLLILLVLIALALWAMVTWLFPWIDTFLPDLLPEGDVTISET